MDQPVAAFGTDMTLKGEGIKVPRRICVTVNGNGSGSGSGNGSSDSSGIGGVCNSGGSSGSNCKNSSGVNSSSCNGDSNNDDSPDRNHAPDNDNRREIKNRNRSTSKPIGTSYRNDNNINSSDVCEEDIHTDFSHSRTDSHLGLVRGNLNNTNLDQNAAPGSKSSFPVDLRGGASIFYITLVHTRMFHISNFSFCAANNYSSCFFHLVNCLC